MDSLGEGVSTIVVGAFDSLSDTIVEFAKTGKLNMRQFFQDIFAQLLKLATNRLLAQLIGGFMGGGGGGFGLPGLATGGSILPSGPGNTDSQVVAFKKRPDERVDVLTPGQQKAQREAMNGSNEEGSSGGGSVNVNVAVVLSEEDVANAMKGQAGQTIIIKGIQSNSSTIRKILS
jgi:microcystin-dependent protein